MMKIDHTYKNLLENTKKITQWEKEVSNTFVNKSTSRYSDKVEWRNLERGVMAKGTKPRGLFFSTMNTPMIEDKDRKMENNISENPKSVKKNELQTKQNVETPKTNLHFFHSNDSLVLDFQNHDNSDKAYFFQFQTQFLCSRLLLYYFILLMLLNLWLFV